MRAASSCHGCLWRLASRQRALRPPWRFLRPPAHPPSAPCRRSQDPERSAHSDRAASTHQRQPRSQDLVAERVRQDHSRNGGGVREGAAALCRTAYPARPLDLPSVRPSQHLHERCGHCSGGRRLRASGCACARACRSRRAHPGYPCHGRSWRVRKRCCTCSSGRASTSRRRSRRRRRQLRFRTFLAGSLWR